MNREAQVSSTIPRRSPGVPKVRTGVHGLDTVLGGGIPRGTLTLLSGGPGTGKTMLGLEFLVRSAQDGQPGILLTFEEREDALRGYAEGFGWNLPDLEAQGRLVLISARLQPDAILSGDFDLRGILGILRKKTEEIQADRLLIDAPDVLLRLLGDAAKERAELHNLYEWLRDTGLTTILTVKDPVGSEFAHYEFLDYMADCVIHLDQRVYEQISTRRLRVIKLRGSPYGRNEYPFGFSSQGVQIIPVTQTSLQHRALGECLSSGIESLDQILGGGVPAQLLHPHHGRLGHGQDDLRVFLREVGNLRQRAGPLHRLRRVLGRSGLLHAWSGHRPDAGAGFRAAAFHLHHARVARHRGTPHPGLPGHR